MGEPTTLQTYESICSKPTELSSSFLILKLSFSKYLIAFFEFFIFFNFVSNVTASERELTFVEITSFQGPLFLV